MKKTITIIYTEMCIYVCVCVRACVRACVLCVCVKYWILPSGLQQCTYLGIAWHSAILINLYTSWYRQILL